MIAQARGTDRYSETWSLFEKGSGEEQYSLSGQFADKTVVVSPDGRSLAVLDDFCFGKPEPSRVVVTFYRDAKATRRYSLADLSVPLDLVESSASHFTWYESLTGGVPQVKKDELQVRTFDLRKLSFDLSTGELKSVSPDPRLIPGTFLVYGTLKTDSWKWPGMTPKAFIIEPYCVVYGAVEHKHLLRFKLLPDEIAEGKARLSDGYPGTFLIRGGRVLDSWDILLNNCNRIPGKEVQR
jgi:hypothetical protein